MSEIHKHIYLYTYTYIYALYCIWEPKIKKILWKTQNGFRRNWSMKSQIFIIRGILGVRVKHLEITISSVDFSEPFDSIHRVKLGQILLAYNLFKNIAAVIMMLIKNTKVNVRSPNGGTDYFDIVAGVLQGDTLTPYPFIICLNYVLRMSIDLMKENRFKLAKESSRRYPAQTITDDTDVIAILANTPAQAETPL